jgi:DNA-binding HxlR family transcriptional regulator
MGSTVRTKEHRDLLALIGDKWAMLVIEHLGAHGVCRFSELKRGVPGISQRMLTLTLRGLERTGIVKRTVFSQIPQRVDYQLTQLGGSLEVPCRNMTRWADSFLPMVKDAQVAFDSAA